MVLKSGARQFIGALLFCFAGLVSVAAWDRGELKDYQERRARLASQTQDGIVVLFGYDDADVAASTTAFHQNEAFYYLTGWNEPSAMMMLVPRLRADGASATQASLDKEILYIPPRNITEEKWTGPKLFPESPQAVGRTGFPIVRGTTQLQPDLLEALKTFPKIYTELTPQAESGEDAFIADVVGKLKMLAPLASLQDIRPAVQAMRAVKSPGEIALIRKAVENSVDAHLALMKAVKPGAWEYETGALMQDETARRGSEWLSYPSIVGSGFNSTVLHYNANDRQMDGGDVVVIDAAGSFSGYAADITRTLPISGKFTARQREIYEIVRGAQAAVLAAAKPGAIIGRGKGTLYEIAFNYINSHGKDAKGEPLGQYFIHGLGHSVGLNVHDPFDNMAPLAAGMIVTVEPGIYIPDEKLGVRIEDMILITPTGYELLTKRLPSAPDEIERLMK